MPGLPRLGSGQIRPKSGVAPGGGLLSFTTPNVPLFQGNRYWLGCFATLEITADRIEWGIWAAGSANSMHQGANEVAWTQIAGPTATVFA